MSRQHSIAVVTSIHQPNSDLLMLFDNVYVLAKRGFCIYSGRPDHLYDHLKQGGIECKEYQAPIEVLIKFSFSKNDHEQILLEATMKNKLSLEERCSKEGKLSSNGVPHESVGFSSRHFLYLVGRAMTSLYVSQWKSMIVQFAFMMLTALILIIVFDRHIGEPAGCFTMMDSINISNKKEDLRIESLSIQNTNFFYLTDLMVCGIFNFYALMSFASEVRIFTNEHNNGWYFFY